VLEKPAEAFRAFDIAGARELGAFDPLVPKP